MSMNDALYASLPLPIFLTIECTRCIIYVSDKTPGSGPLRLAVLLPNILALGPLRDDYRGAGERPYTIVLYNVLVLLVHKEAVRLGFEAIRSSHGSLAGSVQDCELFCKTIFGQKDSSHQNIPMSYHAVELPSKLRFGYYLSDGMMESSPACKRAVLETVSALRKQGHQCIEFTSPLNASAMEVFLGLTSSDGYKKMLSHLDSDPMEDSLFLVTLGPRLPSFVCKLACWIAKTFLGDSLFPRFFSLAREKSVLEFTDFTDQRNKVAAAWYEQVWDKYGFDGIIAPVQSLPVIPHGGATYLSVLAAATITYNVIDSPVGTIPVTRVNSDTDNLSTDFVVGASGRSKMFETRMYLGKNPVYDPKAMEGWRGIVVP
ncbi:amidase signature domain-containing protein [Suillus spraguei]|nr:amidase signature domain-containing protein [Suillus spraguei]